MIIQVQVFHSITVLPDGEELFLSFIVQIFHLMEIQEHHLQETRPLVEEELCTAIPILDSPLMATHC